MRGKSQQLIDVSPKTTQEIFWDLDNPDIDDCFNCACIGCAHLDCDIRDECEECRPMTLLYCSERIQTTTPALRQAQYHPSLSRRGVMEAV